MPAVAILSPVDYGPMGPLGYTTTPWSVWGLQIPGYGSPPTSAQFEVEVLQPPNVDGNRYRIGGAHFPEFQLIGIIPAQDFITAGIIAREVERSRAWQIALTYTNNVNSTQNFYVKEAKAYANAARILGAEAAAATGDGGPAPASEALASVDISLTLQYFAP